MFHFCIFGGQGGELSPDKKVYVTIFGACELKRPTVARQIIEMRQASRQPDRHPMRFFLTVCGATELQAPTLAEEYIDLQDALRAGLLTLEEWDRSVARIGSSDDFRASSFTLLGGFSTSELPSEDEELERLALNRHLGTIPEPASRALMLAVGRGGSQRPAAVRQAVAAARVVPA